MSKPIQKKAMPVPITPEITNELAGEDWYVHIESEGLPPEVGIQALRKIDPETALLLPKIYNPKKEDLKDINGKTYFLVDIDPSKQYEKMVKGFTGKLEKFYQDDKDYQQLLESKYWPGVVQAIEVGTGTLTRFKYDEVSDQLAKQKTKITEELMAKANEGISNHNQRIDKLDNATKSVTLLPLQLRRLVGIIDERIGELDGIINTQQAQLDAPPPSGIGSWKEHVDQYLGSPGANERDFIDSVINKYKYNYDKMVQDLESGSLAIPTHFANPEAVKKKLMEIGNLAYTKYVDKIEKDKAKPEEPSDFDIMQYDVGNIEPFALEDIPSPSGKTEAYRSYEAYQSSLRSSINNSQRDKDQLTVVKDSAQSIIDELGELGDGEHANEFLRTNPKGQAAIQEIQNLSNDMGLFVRRYVRKLINEENKVDPRKMGSKGTMGSTLVALGMLRIFAVIRETLAKIGINVDGAGPNVETGPQVIASTRDNKTFIKMSKSEWLKIGREAKWI